MLIPIKTKIKPTMSQTSQLIVYLPNMTFDIDFGTTAMIP